MTRDVTEADFDTEVLKSAEPVLVDFWAEWCAPCKVIDPILEELSGGLEGRLKIVKLDVAAHPGVAVRYNVRNMPTLLVFRDGEPADIKVGSQSRVALAKWLETHAA